MSKIVTILKMDHQGRGIGFINGKIIFVPNTLLKEVCKVKITKEKKNYFEGVVLEYIKMSERRVKPKCPYYSFCGGCDLEHMSYPDTISLKEKMLTELFSKNLSYEKDILVESCDNPWNYRNKIQLKVVDGRVGFYEFKTHELIEIKECKIAKKAINDVLKDFSMYQFFNGELVIRVNENDEILMNLITKDDVNILKDFFKRHKIVGILKNQKCVYGVPYFFERKNGVLYQISYDSFFQVNGEVSQKLFQYVQSIVGSSKNVLDLYCGVGTLGLQISKNVSSVTGIEVVSNAILNAIKNAKLNHAENCSFHLGKVEDLIDKIPENFDNVIVDPPRSGLDQKTIEIILKMLPQQIIYVSCNPMTLIRDLKKIEQFYFINSIKGFDMFSYTKHVECVCVLNRR